MSVDNPEASFNPRIRKGCDISLPGPLSWQQNVSIHASVKDATRKEWYMIINGKFQSTYLLLVDYQYYTL